MFDFRVVLDKHPGFECWSCLKVVAMHFDADIANTTLRFQQQQARQHAPPRQQHGSATLAPLLKSCTVAVFLMELPALRVRTVQAEAVTVYKVAAGGEGASLAAYNACAGGAAAHDSLDGDGSLQHQEWRALYTQFQRERARNDSLPLGKRGQAGVACGGHLRRARRGHARGRALA